MLGVVLQLNPLTGFVGVPAPGPRGPLSSPAAGECGFGRNAYVHTCASDGYIAVVDGLV